MDKLELFNIVAIICEVVGFLGVVIGVPLSKYSKDNYSFPLSSLFCLAVGGFVHLGLHFGFFNIFHKPKAPESPEAFSFLRHRFL